MMHSPRPATSPAQNRLLAKLPEAELARLLRHLEPVTLLLSDILYEPGMQLRHAYFPTTPGWSHNRANAKA